MTKQVKSRQRVGRKKDGRNIDYGRTAGGGHEAGRGYFTLDGGVTYTLIPSDAIASMNLWAFRSDFTEDLVNNYEVRLKEGIKSNPLKFEETLSDAVQNILERGECSVKVINTDSKWFGMTYREDIPQVKEELERLVKEGIYPENF